MDLLGLTEEGEPVVVELKTGESKDTPLHALLEAATYATALRKNWQQVESELKAVPLVRDLGLKVSAKPEKWPLVLLAPPAYWEAWGTGTPTGRTVSDLAREAYRQLRESFGAEHMPVREAEVDWRVGSVKSAWDSVSRPSV